MELLPLIGTHLRGIGDLPAPEIVDRVQEFERAGIAFLLHAADPMRIDIARADFIGEETRHGRDAALCLAQIGDIERRAGAT